MSWNGPPGGASRFKPPTSPFDGIDRSVELSAAYVNEIIGLTCPDCGKSCEDGDVAPGDVMCCELCGAPSIAEYESPRGGHTGITLRLMMPHEIDEMPRGERLSLQADSRIGCADRPRYTFRVATVGKAHVLDVAGGGAPHEVEVVARVRCA